MLMSMHHIITTYKVSSKVCFACQSFSERGSNVASNRGRIDLREGLKRYVNLDVAEGWICRGCISKLQMIMLRVENFRQAAIHGKEKNVHQQSTNEDDETRIKPEPLDVEDVKTKQDSSSSKKDLAFCIHVLSEKSTSSSQNTQQQYIERRPLFRTILPKKVPSPKETLQVDKAPQAGIVKGTGSCGQTAECAPGDDEPCSTIDHSYAAKASQSKEHDPTKGTRLVLEVLNKNETVLDKAQCLCLLSAVQSYSTEIITTEFCKIPALRENLVRVVSDEIGSRPDKQKVHKTKESSVLMLKNFLDLKTHSWEDVISEFVRVYPELVQILLKMMLPSEALESTEKTQQVVPKLAVIYGILLQHRNHELSRVQRLVGCLLADNVVEQKVYDRLNKLGMCSSYNRMQQLRRGIVAQSPALPAESSSKKRRAQKSASVPGFSEIGETFDQETDVVKRMKGPALSSAERKAMTVIIKE